MKHWGDGVVLFQNETLGDGDKVFHFETKLPRPQNVSPSSKCLEFPIAIFRQIMIIYI